MTANLRILIIGSEKSGKSSLLGRLKGFPHRIEYFPTAEAINAATVNWNYKATSEVIKVDAWELKDQVRNDHFRGSSGMSAIFQERPHNHWLFFFSRNLYLQRKRTIRARLCDWSHSKYSDASTDSSCSEFHGFEPDHWRRRGGKNFANIIVSGNASLLLQGLNGDRTRTQYDLQISQCTLLVSQVSKSHLFSNL